MQASDHTAENQRNRDRELPIIKQIWVHTFKLHATSSIGLQRIIVLK